MWSDGKRLYVKSLMEGFHVADMPLVGFTSRIALEGVVHKGPHQNSCYAQAKQRPRECPVGQVWRLLRSSC